MATDKTCSDEKISTGEDNCIICKESLTSSSITLLSCGHSFHTLCLQKNIDFAIKNKTISFSALKCPVCKQDIECPQLEESMKPLKELKEDITKHALARLTYEGRDKDSALTDPESEFYQRPKEYALHTYVYKRCSKCNEPYFCGTYDCERAIDESNEDCICASCSSCNKDICPKHGPFGMMYKCRYCCNLATWFSYGTTHFCSECHMKAGTVTKTPKDQLPKCDGPETCHLGIAHPPNGEEFCLGCALCMAGCDKLF